MDRYLTTAQAAKVTGVSARTVAKWYDEGLVKGFKIPGSTHRRVSLASLRELLVNCGLPLDSLVAKYGDDLNGTKIE